MSYKFWDERYTGNEFAYGRQPNSFFKEQLDKLKPGKILLPCEGEGRNAVYAAQKGWSVDAFDYSSVAQHKAIQWANSNSVQISYTVKEMENLEPPVKYYNAVGLIYAHFSPTLRKSIHQKCADSLAPEGVLILEAFDKSQLQNSSGGPKDVNMLYSAEDLMDDFQSLQIASCTKTTIELNEGPYHQGMADVVRLVARKK